MGYVSRLADARQHWRGFRAGEICVSGGRYQIANRFHTALLEQAADGAGGDWIAAHFLPGVTQ